VDQQINALHGDRTFVLSHDFVDFVDSKSFIITSLVWKLLGKFA